MKTLELTENKVLSKSNQMCIDNRDHNPDQKMIELITEKIGCQLPWSQNPVGPIKNCTIESDYDEYFKSIFNHQKEISNIPKKCIFDTLVTSHLEDSSKEGNETSILLDLTVTEGQVSY